MLCVAGAETQLDDESTDHGREQDPAPPVRSLDPLLAAAAESNNAAEPPRPPPFPPLLVDGEAGADRTTTPAGSASSRVAAVLQASKSWKETAGQTLHQAMLALGPPGSMSPEELSRELLFLHSQMLSGKEVETRASPKGEVETTVPKVPAKAMPVTPPAVVAPLPKANQEPPAPGSVPAVKGVPPPPVHAAVPAAEAPKVPAQEPVPVKAAVLPQAEKAPGPAPKACQEPTPEQAAALAVALPPPPGALGNASGSAPAGSLPASAGGEDAMAMDVQKALDELRPARVFPWCIGQNSPDLQFSFCRQCSGKGRKLVPMTSLITSFLAWCCFRKEFDFLCQSFLSGFAGT